MLVAWLGGSGVFYLIDCVVGHFKYPDMPWYLSGYHTGGFGLTLLYFLGGLVVVLVRVLHN